jgi:hypothetical protein
MALSSFEFPAVFFSLSNTTMVIAESFNKSVSKALTRNFTFAKKTGV